MWSKPIVCINLEMKEQLTWLIKVSLSLSLCVSLDNDYLYSLNLDQSLNSYIMLEKLVWVDRAKVNPTRIILSID